MLRHSVMRLLYLIVICFAATSCASLPPAPELRIVKAEVPASLLVCQAAPAVPAEPVTDPQIGVYIIDLWAAWDDCRARLREVGKLVVAK